MTETRNTQRTENRLIEGRRIYDVVMEVHKKNMELIYADDERKTYDWDNSHKNKLDVIKEEEQFLNEIMEYCMNEENEDEIKNEITKLRKLREKYEHKQEHSDSCFNLCNFSVSILIGLFAISSIAALNQ